MKYDIVTIGDASEDVFVRPSELKISDSRSVISGKVMSFELGEKISIEDMEDEVGGSAANVAVGMARMGYRTGIVTAVGEDDAGEKIVKRLKKEGVEDELINIKEKNKTNFAVILNTPDGERTILVYHAIKYEDLKVKKSVETKWYFLAPVGHGSEELQEALVNITAEKGTFLAWNPGSMQIKDGARHHRALLKNTTVLFLNREEAIKFMDFPVRPRDEEVMKRLHMMGPKIIVMTKGGDGAKAYDGEVYYNIEILKDTKKIDATGAGDSFATGFLGRLLAESTDGEFNKELICEALKYAMIDSASVVGKVGAQPGLLSIEQIEKGITDHPRLQVEVYS